MPSSLASPCFRRKRARLIGSPKTKALRETCNLTPVKHAFGFTPSMSLFVDCTDEKEFERVFAALSAEGETLMPVDNYGFSTRYTWFNDRFGVSWQVNLK